jgi:pimeloyl-ACP methyl ester carboxylesterase
MKNEAVEKPKKITYETLWKAIIRPPRDDYEEEELGSPIFTIDKRIYVRKDFELLNFQGYLIKVSMIEPEIRERPQEIMPCVIYLHANASSRIEGLHIRRFLLKRNINLCVFDFQGSGMSEGDYISLGYHEKYQVKNIVDFVEKYPGVGKIGLWGRSMGAATSLIYTAMDKRICATVADSPFGDFRKLAKEMVLNQVKVPGFLVEGAISIIGKSCKNRNGMDINEIKAIEAVKKCNVPVIFIHARDDELVPYHHSEDLLNNYNGKIKELKSVNGGHNGRRPTALMEYVGDFFAVHLNSGYTPGDLEKTHSLKSKILVKSKSFDKGKGVEKGKETNKSQDKESEETPKDTFSNSTKNVNKEVNLGKPEDKNKEKETQKEKEDKKEENKINEKDNDEK